MGAANSKIEEEKALVLCRERKRFIRKALDERCSLAAAHVSYVDSLRNTGMALRKYVEPEVPAGSSLYASTSATPEPLALTDKAISQFSSSLSLSQRVETAESFSPVPSPLSSGRLHRNYMKAGKTSYTTVKEKPPNFVTATLHTASDTPKHLAPESDEVSSFGAPSTPTGSQTWDYFGIFHPIGDHLASQNGRGLNNGFDNADEIKRLREEEGIPELEEEGEKASATIKYDQEESEDDFDQPSDEPLVRMFKNQNPILEHQLESDSEVIQSMEDLGSETKQHNEDNMMLTNGISESVETPEIPPVKAEPRGAACPSSGKTKESDPEINREGRDLLSCMKAIEELFIRASESGREVPRMLEANKVQFRPLFPEEKANGSKAYAFLTACLSCCKEETAHPPASTENDIKYITWHRSMSSLSTSSRNFLGPTMNSDTDELGSNLFHSTYMNSGSHASTLDRLYAWERKLYDEVKASGVIRRKYDMMCRQLRHKESTGEKQMSIDKTRAIIKDLHSRIGVAIQRIDAISKKIEEIRDKELQPQLEELIGGLLKMWGIMFECHTDQYNIVLSASNNGGTKVSIRTESQRPILVLEFELNSLSSNFTEWMSAQKSYVNAIREWLNKGIDSSLNSNRSTKSSRKKLPKFSPTNHTGPPIFVTCQNWLDLLEKLPTKDVVSAIKDLVNVTTHFLPRQEKGHAISKSSFSLPGKTQQQNNAQEHVHTNDSTVDWSLNYDHLQSALTIFLDRLKTFAASAVSMYTDLQESIDRAREAYEGEPV